MTRDSIKGEQKRIVNKRLRERRAKEKTIVLQSNATVRRDYNFIFVNKIAKLQDRKS